MSDDLIRHHGVSARRSARGSSVLVFLGALLSSGCASTTVVRDRGPIAGGQAAGVSGPAAIGNMQAGLGRNEIELAVVDVSQGDGLVLRTKAGHTVVIDTGTHKGGAAVLSFLTAHHVRVIDLLILTHPHADHIGGAQAIIGAIPVRKVWISGYAGTSKTHLRLMEAMRAKRIPIRIVRRGLVRKLEPGLSLHVLAPEDPLISGSRSDANANSVVVWIEHGSVDFLLEGDAEKETERRLLVALKDRGPPIFEVLKVAHHGSRYASGPAFLKRVQPKTAVISCGRHNRYHHPHEETLRRLKRIGARIYRTDQNGTILIRSNGRTYKVLVAPAPFPQASLGIPWRVFHNQAGNLTLRGARAFTHVYIGV